MKYILVTGKPTGKLERLRRGLKDKHWVPVRTYHAELGDDARPELRYRFTVVRHSSRVVFRGLSDKFGLEGECPPSRVCAPYRGRLETVPRNGECLLLYEVWSKTRDQLLGEGTTKRSRILIHAGPGSSAGCISVAGGNEGWRSFHTRLKTVLGDNEELAVFLEPRHE